MAHGGTPQQQQHTRIRKRRSYLIYWYKPWRYPFASICSRNPKSMYDPSPLFHFSLSSLSVCSLLSNRVGICSSTTKRRRRACGSYHMRIASSGRCSHRNVRLGSGLLCGTHLLYINNNNTNNNVLKTHNNIIGIGGRIGDRRSFRRRRAMGVGKHDARFDAVSQRDHSITSTRRI